MFRRIRRQILAARWNFIEPLGRHLKSAKNSRTKKRDWTDTLGFIVLPIFLALIMVVLDDNPEEILGANGVTSISLVIGLLFNALVILIDKKSAMKITEIDRREAALNATASVIFTISVGFVVLFTLYIYPYAQDFHAIFRKSIQFACWAAIGLFYTTCAVIFNTMWILAKAS